MLRRPRMTQDSDIEQALIAARPAHESLSAEKAQAVFEHALTASRGRERRPRRWLMPLVLGPAATAVVVAGLFLWFSDSGALPPPPTDFGTLSTKSFDGHGSATFKAAPLKERPLPTLPTARAARIEPAAPPTAHSPVTRTGRRTARRSFRRHPASPARLARTGK